MCLISFLQILSNFQINFTVSLMLYFRHILGIFKTYSAIFILVQALRALALLVTIRFSHTQVYSEYCTQHLGRFEVTQSPILFTDVSHIFKHIHKVTHIDAYLSTLGLTSVRSNIKKYLFFKLVSFTNHCSNLFGTFFLFQLTLNIFFLHGSITIRTITTITTCNTTKPPTSPTLACHPDKHGNHTTHASTLLMSLTLTCHPRHPHQHATHATHTSTPPK